MTTENAPAPSSDATPKPGPMGRRGKRINVFAYRFPRFIKVVRVTTLLATILVCFGAFSLHRASGQLGEQLLTMGDVLMQYDRAEHQDQTRVVLVNGQQMRFSSGISTDDLHTVLEHFVSVCDAHDGSAVEQFTSLGHTLPGRSGRWLDPVYRLEGDDGGVVACLDLGEDDVPASEIASRVARFNRTSDVHDIGDIRYVYAEPMAEGGTHFVTFWTDGSFRLAHLLPRDGHDAAGEDLAHVPRPPGSYRTMFASEAGNPDTGVQYMGSSMTEWELEAFYRDELTREGWTLTTVRDEAQPEGLRIVEATNADASQTLFATLDTDDAGRGLATIALSR
jgi:hypothetical protein